MTEHDLHSKLRSGGISRQSDVFAVTLETTGDVSIIETSHRPVDARLFENVRGAERLDLGG